MNLYQGVEKQYVRMQSCGLINSKTIPFPQTTFVHNEF